VFDTLTDKLQGAFRSLRGGTMSEETVDVALREIRMGLLEADVHFRVAKEFIERVRVKAVGQDVLRSLTPDQAVIRVVRDEMITLLGGDHPARLELGSRIPAVVLMTGLQGSGKTTTSAKLAKWLVKGGHHPLLVSTDVYRPAAREQLLTLAKANGLHIHHPEDVKAPLDLLRGALAEARSTGHDVVLVDTAGRLHIDDEMMAELESLRDAATPSEILYVADAMTGQDAVKSAAEFQKRIGITGLVLSKLDGDARGGAALSAASVTQRPVKFAGVGEKIDEFELFQADRMVGRILGMGDVLGLIERAEQAFDRESAEKMVERLRKNDFTLEDFREQMAQIKKMGPLDQILSMLPGMSAVKDVDVAAGEREMKRTAAIIDSMTPGERRDPSVLNGSRKKRVARGAGANVEDVNRLLKQFVQTRKLMKSMGGGAKAMRRMAAQMGQMGRLH
jgi:signal recognition particle subunit SRP54